jgi:bisphosphoglycerate-independent phosphoglycerate mutase (AlkP superfamily)
VQVLEALDGCISAETAQGIASHEAAALITADETEREKRNEEKLQVLGQLPVVAHQHGS